MDFSTAFDLFSDCYVYGCVFYIAALFIYHLSLSLLALIDEHQQTKQPTKPDFYEQVKELLNPSTETVFKPPVKPFFDTMTIRELRTHIQDNQLQQHVRDCLGKTVSNARKHELIKALS